MQGDEDSSMSGTERHGSAERRGRVLVVDDEDLVRIVLSRKLALHGFEVLLARDGLEALEVAQQAIPDVVLTDLNMPRCNGEQLCLELRACPAMAAIPVVMMTGGPTDEARMQAAGCAAVLYKPLPEDLPELLASLVEERARRSHEAGTRPIGV